jgi:hypothetical protein
MTDHDDVHTRAMADLAVALHLVISAGDIRRAAAQGHGSLCPHCLARALHLDTAPDDELAAITADLVRMADHVLASHGRWTRPVERTKENT